MMPNEWELITPKCDPSSQYPSPFFETKNATKVSSANGNEVNVTDQLSSISVTTISELMNEIDQDLTNDETKKGTTDAEIDIDKNVKKFISEPVK